MLAAILKKFDAKIREVPRSGFGKRDLCVGTLHKVCKSHAGIYDWCNRLETLM
jgi:hypothetical protein